MKRASWKWYPITMKEMYSTQNCLLCCSNHLNTLDEVHCSITFHFSKAEMTVHHVKDMTTIILLLLMVKLIIVMLAIIPMVNEMIIILILQCGINCWISNSYTSRNIIRTTIHLHDMLYHCIIKFNRNVFLYLTFTFVPQSKVRDSTTIVCVKGLLTLQCLTLMSTLAIMSKMQHQHQQEEVVKKAIIKCTTLMIVIIAETSVHKCHLLVCSFLLHAHVPSTKNDDVTTCNHSRVSYTMTVSVSKCCTTFTASPVTYAMYKMLMSCMIQHTLWRCQLCQILPQAFNLHNSQEKKKISKMMIISMIIAAITIITVQAQHKTKKLVKNVCTRRIKQKIYAIRCCYLRYVTF